MNNQIPFSLGLLLIISIFLLCTFIVFGIKTLLIKFKQVFFETKQVKTFKPKKKRRKAKSPITTTIEIDPTKVDKIYMKKTG